MVWGTEMFSSWFSLIYSKFPSAKTMLVKCKGPIFLCSLISLLTQLLLLTLASASLNIHVPNYYDEADDPPTFQESLFPEPLDLTADTRFSDSETAWELKINRDLPPSSSSNLKKSSPVHRSNSKPKRMREPQSSGRTNCGTSQFHEPPPISAQNLIGPTLKRSDVATTGEELKERQRMEKILAEDGSKSKKNHPESYWACETTFTWTNLGADYYPRHVRTATCNSSRCANGRYHCVPRSYTLKVLKRFAVSDSVSVQDNNLLPPELRSDWRLVNHEIVHCCECSRPVTLGK